MSSVFVLIIDFILFNDTPCNTSHDAHEKVGKWIYLIGYVKKFARNHEHYMMLIIQNMGRRWWNMSVQKEKVDNVYARLYRSHYFLNTCFKSYVCYNYKFLFSLNCIKRNFVPQIASQELDICIKSEYKNERYRFAFYNRYERRSHLWW